MAALSGLRGVELSGQGPGPFCAGLLVDHGAQVTRIVAPARPTQATLGGAAEPMNGGRINVELDLKSAAGIQSFFELIDDADFLIEGFRPGVTEQLGIGPDTCMARNPRLVYARITGWGQTGPMAARAGHDINYIGLTGALDAIGTAAEPIAPLNLVGDYAGGAMFAAFGILAALVERQTSGLGQVVDAAMVDGAGFLMAPFHELIAGGGWSATRAVNILDGGAPFYGVYETLDGKHMSVGALEPQFYAQLCTTLGFDGDAAFDDQMNRSKWPAMRDRLTARFASRTREQWSEVFASVDACVAPVLNIGEVHHHDHHLARHAYVAHPSGAHLPAAAPRLSRTPGSRRSGPDVMSDDSGLGPTDEGLPG